MLLLLLGTLPIRAQPAEGPEPTREQLQTQISILLDEIKALKAANAQASAQSSSVDAELRSAYVAAKKKEYQYIAKMMELNIQAL